MRFSCVLLFLAVAYCTNFKVIKPHVPIKAGPGQWYATVGTAALGRIIKSSTTTNGYVQFDKKSFIARDSLEQVPELTDKPAPSDKTEKKIVTEAPAATKNPLVEKAKQSSPRPQYGENVVYYSVNDARWAKLNYTASTDVITHRFKEYGSAPTCLAMAVSTFASPSITPDKVAKFALENDLKVTSSAKALKFFTKAATYYGLRIYTTNDFKNVQKYLQKGSLVVALMNKGYFTTKTGTFVLIHSMNSKFYFVHDPENYQKVKATKDVIKNQSKMFYILSKK